MIRTIFICLFLSILSFESQAQKDDENQIIFVGTSPSILKHGDGDVNYVNSLYSYWAISQYRDNVNDATFILNRYRRTEFQQLMRFTYGYSKSERWDLGFELRLARTRLDDYARRSPFLIFQNNKKSDTENAHGISTAGFRLRYQPFLKQPSLVTYLNVQFPVGSIENQVALNQYRPIFGIGLTNFLNPNPSFYFFYQAEYSFLPRNQALTFEKTGKGHPYNKNTHNTSLSGTFVKDILYQKLYVMGGTVYQMSFEPTVLKPFNRTSNLLFGNVGLYIRPSYNINFTLNYVIPLILENKDESTFIPRNSFTGFSLGARLIF